MHPLLTAAGGGYTSTNPELRRVVPDDPRGRKCIKLVYVVLEAQYQSALSTAVKNINAQREGVCVELVGYLLEELRDASNYAAFEQVTGSVRDWILHLYLKGVQSGQGCYVKG